MARRVRRKGSKRKPGFGAGRFPDKPAFPDPVSLPAADAQASPRSRTRGRRIEQALERYDRDRLAAAAAREPMDYRGSHPALEGDPGPAVERHGLSLPDSRGDIGNPHRVYDTLATLRRNGSIGDAELEAGRALEQDFARAGLDPLHAADPGRIPARGRAELSDQMVAGRRRVQGAMAALGGLGTAPGSAAWAILGTGQTVKEWAAVSQFGQGGRSIDEKVAKGVFVAALGVLAAHYGTLGRRARGGRQTSAAR